MKVCLIDAFRPDDPALLNSHWVAERTARVLGAHAGAEVEAISADAADAAAVAAVLSRSFDGYAYFGHGRQHLLFRDKSDSDAPIPILGIEQVSQIASRWFHAFACLSGVTLCPEAAKAGAAAYLGYRVPVVVEWDVEDLPGELSKLLEDLVTAATLSLSEGKRSRDAIRRDVRGASDRVLEWMDLNWEACMSIPWIQNTGLQKLATLLHIDLMLEGAAVLP